MGATARVERLHFDDTIDTVLATDVSTAFGRQAMWRQLVDLIGRGRAPVTRDAIRTLHSIRSDVPPPVRAASARALEFADPPPAIIYLLGIDELPVALPVLRSARMDAQDWIALLPRLSPAARSLLRGRRDLGDAVVTALAAYGPSDLVLEPGTGEGELIAAQARVPEPSATSDSIRDSDGGALSVDWTQVTEMGAASDLQAPFGGDAVPKSADAPGDVPVTAGQEAASVDPMLDTAEAVAVPAADPGPFLSVGSIAREMPSVALAFRRAREGEKALGEPEADKALPAPGSGEEASAEGPFRISDVVARIDAYQRGRDAGTIPERPKRTADHFRFETDADGVMRWIDGVERAPLIGLSIDFARSDEASRVDGVASGAFRRRARFSDARLTVEGASQLAGNWLISALPIFDPRSGRFTGYRGTARRPRRDERVEPAMAIHGAPAAQQLRQLVHELRTPAGAISGFAEMIEQQYFGPVPEGYRECARDIRDDSRDLVGVIEDLDLAARMEDDALDLRPQAVALAPMLEEIAGDLSSLLSLRGAELVLSTGDRCVQGDRRALGRLLSRLIATLAASAGRGERIVIAADDRMAGQVTLTFDRPSGLSGYPGDADAPDEEEAEDRVTLGTGFALRLARNLARELGGALLFGQERLTLQLPAAETEAMEQVHAN